MEYDNEMARAGLSHCSLSGLPEHACFVLKRLETFTLFRSKCRRHFRLRIRHYCSELWRQLSSQGPEAGSAAEESKVKIPPAVNAAAIAMTNQFHTGFSYAVIRLNVTARLDRLAAKAIKILPNRERQQVKMSLIFRSLGR